MSLRERWIDQCLEHSIEDALFYTGARKILRHRTFTLPMTDDLTLADCGYTRTKMTLLKKLYFNEEHTEQVQALWQRRVGQAKYGSVGLSTYHHLTKSDPAKKSKRASVMGPCLMGITFTLTRKNEDAQVDCFYRTTELFKKFPADLVFIRDVVLPYFRTPDYPLEYVNFHFANVTCHPMYFCTLLPSLEFPIDDLNEIRGVDKFFWQWVVKWTARYICPEFEHGIKKFAQALRVQKDMLDRLDPQKLVVLQRYMRRHHPGYRYTTGEYK